MARPSGHLLPVLALLALGLTLGLVAQGKGLWATAWPETPSTARTAPPPDPEARGPYAVGVTRRTFSRASSTTGAPRALETVVWYPAASAGAPLPADQTLAAPIDAEPARDAGPFPIVLFSHGLGGVPWSLTHFTTHLASHSFVVLAPAHPGTTRADCPQPQPSQPCSVANTSTRPLIGESIANRPDDLSFLIDQASGPEIGADMLLAGLLDPGRAGMTGWSLGGHSALRATAKDRRSRGIIAMAPGGPLNMPALTEAAPQITAPTMLMWGMLDDRAEFWQHRSLWRALDSAGPEHWLVALPRAGHYQFADTCRPGASGCDPSAVSQEQAHALVDRWATAFLRRHVALDNRYAPLLDAALAAGNPEVQISFEPGR